MEIVSFNLDSNWIIFSFQKPDYFDIKDMQRNGYKVYKLSKHFIHSYSGIVSRVGDF